MAQVVFMLIIFSRILSATSVGVFQYFRENTELSNKAPKNTLNKDIQTSSLFDCGARCDRCCRCFGFNTVTNICRVLLTCDQNDVIGIEEGWIYHYRNELAKPENCHSLFKRGYTTSGIMTIHPWDECDRNYRSVDDFCDMDTSGGGWTVLRRRISGSINFNRSWREYMVGFVNLMDNFWIGDSMINTEHTGKLNRNLPDILFSAYDQDNDGKSSGNCASTYAGGWWFNSCYAGYLGRTVSGAGRGTLPSPEEGVSMAL